MNAKLNQGLEEIQEHDIGYDDEVLDAGWNPVVGMTTQELHVQEKKSVMPPDLTTEVAEHFLEKMYTFQR